MSQVFIEMCGEADRASERGLATAQPMDTCPGGLDLPAGQHPFLGRLGALSRPPAQGGETAPCSGVAGSDAERAASLCQADESVVHRDDPQPDGAAMRSGPARACSAR
ncbi:MAG: hypothetical protein J6386_13400 [Candidatus Synoicihabitans palmerolidicus]|nr:hypothetical protein [Candidatus Synoicihabitans palmerolidicus]